MGKGARNRQRRDDEQPQWPGLDGRNPLTLTPERLEGLLPAAFDRIMSAGTSNGRLSLAACWSLGVLAINELADDDVALWADDPSPPGLALVGAAGTLPPPDMPGRDLEDTADAWFQQLDAAGANDRLRAFVDTWDDLARHDNPHGHPLHLAFALALADQPLALEPLPDRLMPAQLLQTDMDADSAYLPGQARRIPGATGTTLQLGPEAADQLGPIKERMQQAAADLGLPPDATLGEIHEAAGLPDMGSPDQLLEMANAFAQANPAAAHAFLATDGLLLTEMNEQLVSEADRTRWLEAAGAHQVVFERLDELTQVDPDDPDSEMDAMDATFDAAGTLLDELVDLVNDGAMLAYHRLLTQVVEHPAGSEMREQVCSAAFNELTHEVDETTFDGQLGDNVRRLIATRFADDDPQMPAATDRALAVADTLPRGDAPLGRAVDDPNREVGVWATLLAVLRAA